MAQTESTSSTAAAPSEICEEVPAVLQHWPEPGASAAEGVHVGQGQPASRLASLASGYIIGKILEVDGGIERPNLDLGIPDL